VPVAAPSHPAKLVRGLGLVATTAIVVGDVVGTGVFLKARVMTCNVGTPGLVLSAWTVAGLLSLAGALTYAELAALMPRAGGEYVYMREAYGRLWAFLFGWMRFFIGSGAGFAALAAGLAIFVNVLVGGALTGLGVTMGGWHIDGIQLVALAAVLVVTLVNCANVSVGGSIASVLTSSKVLLIIAIGIGALVFADGDWSHFTMSGAAGTCVGVSGAARSGFVGFGAAMLAAMWAYNGWNEMTYVSGEVKDPQRNLPRALIAGMVIVIALYCGINLTYFYVLTPIDVASVTPSSSVASEMVARMIGRAASSLMAAAVVVSIFSALQIAVLVGARVPYAMACDGVFFRALSRVSTRTHVPIRALVAQSTCAAVLVLSGSYDTLTDYAIFAILIFWAMTAGAIFVLRRRWPDVERPYRTWGYPVVPMAFLVLTGCVVANTFVSAPRQSIAGVALIALGLPFYWYWSRRSPASDSTAMTG
jgi:basic amino acid/polyamine antiporter, APA family